MDRITWPSLSRSLVAILRGLKAEESWDIAATLIESGFEALEVPLNSPDPFRSIERILQEAPASIMIGAGTVLKIEEVERLAFLGARLMVSPNLNETTLAAAVKKNMVTLPGVFTPSEALRALEIGAAALKFFPALALGPQGINAIKAILPKDTILGAVGGIGEENFEDYLKAGVRLFGIGSNLYRPGMNRQEVKENALRIIAAYDRAKARMENDR